MGDIVTKVNSGSAQNPTHAGELFGGKPVPQKIRRRPNGLRRIFVLAVRAI
jgi:hypothetical protein